MVIFKWKRVTGYEGIKECKKKASPAKMKC